MKILVHGAGKEVGRSCIEMQSKEGEFLLDCGVKLSVGGMEFPTRTDTKNIDAVFISHAHLDHTGCLPLFDHQGLFCPVFATPMTKAITKILLIDSFEIEMAERHGDVAYKKRDVERIGSSITAVDCNKWNDIHGIRWKFTDAGHIPGSASVMLKAENKTILYTGDINTEETLLMQRLDDNYGEKIDVLVIESTYGNRNHPDRKQTEEEFLQTVENRLKSGPVILACFAVGRAQEILLLLQRKKWNVPVYIDGMAREVTELLFSHPSTFRNSAGLKNAYNNAKQVRGSHERDSILNRNEKAIFITTSGMLDGGPVIRYLEKLHSNSNAAVLLTGYQVRDSNGRMLMENKKIRLGKGIVDVKCFVKQFDFSAHAGQGGLYSLIKKISPKIAIINHGDEAEAENLGKFCEKLGIKTFVPATGDVIEI
jgi:putative mRNA 3-end processing factor